VKPRLLPLLLLLLCCLAAACAAPTAAPTPLPLTLTSPAAVTPSALPDPTGTFPPAAAPAVTPSELPTYRGALSAAQRLALEDAARSFISPTPEKARTAAVALGYLGANANPATMCGPLSIAILKQIGLVDVSVRLVDFWYLDPRPGQDEKMLAEVFPAERFEKIEQPLSINEIDYSANPLYPGDFLYLFDGDSGSFEHMLVVSRVDDAGRAYAVTNINTAEGVIIDEVMLYDPANPGAGQFYEWTDWEKRMIGRTGYGGFWLWRALPATP